MMICFAGSLFFCVLYLENGEPKNGNNDEQVTSRGSGALDLKRIFCFALYSTSVIVGSEKNIVGS